MLMDGTSRSKNELDCPAFHRKAQESTVKQTEGREGGKGEGMKG